MAKGDIKIELTEDWLHLKKGDVIERSKNIAYLHLNELKNAKPYEPKKEAPKKRKTKR